MFRTTSCFYILLTCISIYACNETNLTHYLSIDSVTMPLHVWAKTPKHVEASWRNQLTIIVHRLFLLHVIKSIHKRMVRFQKFTKKNLFLVNFWNRTILLWTHCIYLFISLFFFAVMKIRNNLINLIRERYQECRNMYQLNNKRFSDGKYEPCDPAWRLLPLDISLQSLSSWNIQEGIWKWRSSECTPALCASQLLWQTYITIFLCPTGELRKTAFTKLAGRWSLIKKIICIYGQ
jgi:hypothetical protein